MSRFPWYEFEPLAPPKEWRSDYDSLPRDERIRRESGWVEEHLNWRDGQRRRDCENELQWRCFEGVAKGVGGVLRGASPDAVAECASRALLKVVSRLHQWNRSQPIDHWAAIIGRNTATDFLRRRGRTVEVTAESQMGDPDSGAEDCFEGCQAAEGLPDTFCMSDLKDAIQMVVSSNDRAWRALDCLLAGCTTEEELRGRKFSRYKQRLGLCAIWRSLRRLGFYFDEVEWGLRTFSAEDWAECLGGGEAAAARRTA